MILAIQTADATTRLAIYDPKNPGQPAEHIHWESGRQLADQLLTRIAELTASYTLTGVIIFSGPGSFTSLRIGHTVANALADSLNIPVAGATGDDWAQTAIKSLASTPTGHPALPHYGADANITPPPSSPKA